LLRHAGHDVATVSAQGLCFVTDEKLSQVCQSEKRCLITLDLALGNPLLFHPSQYSGIAVLRLPPKPSFDDLLNEVRTLIEGLRFKKIEGKLWIVQRGRIREYQAEEEE